MSYYSMINSLGEIFTIPFPATQVHAITNNVITGVISRISAKGRMKEKLSKPKAPIVSSNIFGTTKIPIRY